MIWSRGDWSSLVPLWKLLSHVRLCNPMNFSMFVIPWNFPSQNTGEGILSLLQGIFLTQGSNTGLLHCRRILYQLNQKSIFFNCWGNLCLGWFPSLLPVFLTPWSSALPGQTFPWRGYRVSGIPRKTKMDKVCRFVDVHLVFLVHG